MEKNLVMYMSCETKKAIETCCATVPILQNNEDTFQSMLKISLKGLRFVLEHKRDPYINDQMCNFGYFVTGLEMFKIDIEIQKYLWYTKICLEKNKNFSYNLISKIKEIYDATYRYKPVIFIYEKSENTIINKYFK